MTLLSSDAYTEGRTLPSSRRESGELGSCDPYGRASFAPVSGSLASSLLVDPSSPVCQHRTLVFASLSSRLGDDGRTGDAMVVQTDEADSCALGAVRNLGRMEAHDRGSEEANMRRFILSRRSASAVIAGCVAVVIAGGVSYAATGGFAGAVDSAGGGKVYACVTARFHTLNLSSAGARCPNGDQRISWNVEGKRGPRGARGAHGSTGLQGLQGSVGAPGAPGAQGAKGNTGATGAQGAKGNIGATGATGSQGAKGDTGATGVQGSKGDTGAPGAQGPPGPAGPGGPPGAAGPAGPTGPIGPAGSLASAYLSAYGPAGGESVPNNSDITFNSPTVAPVGIIENRGHSAFTVTSAGTYLIDVVLQPATGVFLAQLTINGEIIFPASGVSFSEIVSLNAADVVTVRSVGGQSATVAPGTGINIVRIS